jgi:arylsulfatase A-like enzyme
VLTGEQTGAHIRDSVRCEYFDALDPFFTGGEGSFATMYRDDRYKLSLYHDKALGELYDLQTDPWEHNNLWDAPEHQAARQRLIFESFNSHVVLTTDVGSKRIAPM